MQPELLDWSDIPAYRNAIYDRALTAANGFRVQNKRGVLALKDAHYSSPDYYSLAEQKRAVLDGKSLHRRMTGTWQLFTPEGELLGEKKTTVMHVPFLTHRGTFIRNGTGYNAVKQLRLDSAPYTRRTDDGAVETQFNLIPRTGTNFRIQFEPEKAEFYMHHKGRKVPLYPVLKALGADDADMEKAWGNEIFARNQKLQKSPYAVNWLKQFQREDVAAPSAEEQFEESAEATGQSEITGRTGNLEQKEASDLDMASIQRNLAEHFGKMRMDAENAKITLGEPFSNVDSKAMLLATRKQLKVLRDEADPDDRDSLAFQSVHDYSDYIDDAVRNDLNKHGSQLLWRIMGKSRDANSIPPSYLDKHVGDLFNTLLLQSSEQINVMDMHDQNMRVTRLGPGAIPSMDSAPMEARQVQPSYLGYIDSIRAPESISVGLDLRFARGVRKGKDNRLYTQLLDRNGKLNWIDSRKAALSTVAFPDMLKSKEAFVPAIDGTGRTGYVDRKDVDYIVPSGSAMFSDNANLVPFLGGIKGMRLLMAGKHMNQALSLVEREAPLVRTLDPDSGKDNETRLGNQAGIVRAKADGVVSQVRKDGIIVSYADGTEEKHELYDQFPLARKSYLRNIPKVKAGQKVKAGDLLAASNFTDAEGTLALGRNFRVAYMPYHGKNYEDAVVISESAAKKFTSEHSYSEYADKQDNVEYGKAKFLKLFPAKFNAKQLANIDDDGKVKQGTVLHQGDPLFIGVKHLTPGPDTAGRKVNSVAAHTWEHPYPGVVVDVGEGKDGLQAIVRSNQPMQIGDKLCYAEDTEVLTERGWVPVADVTLKDSVCVLEHGGIRYVQPSAVHRYATGDRMYSLDSNQVDLLVTANHSLYVRYSKGLKSRLGYQLLPAEKVCGKQVRHCKHGDWHGSDPEFITFPAYQRKAGQFGHGVLDVAGTEMSLQCFLAVLGSYISNGNSVWHEASGTYGIDIHDDEPTFSEIRGMLDAEGVKYSEGSNPANCRTLRIHDKSMALYFRQFGHAGDKFLPSEVFELSKESAYALLTWLVKGDGHRNNGRLESYYTISKRLADDVQRLCLHAGLAANVCDHQPERVDIIKGVPYHCQRSYRVAIITKKLEPEVNHGHCKTQNGQREAIIEGYDKPVYCITVPEHVLYVRRNGKAVWCGNSGSFGNKGTVAEIISDDRFIRDEKGRPFDLVWNSDGVISRTNSAQLIEAALGKVAEKNGAHETMPQFMDEDAVDFAERKLAAAKLKSTETVFDPILNRRVPKVFTGVAYTKKLHHTSDSKGKARNQGAYSAEGTPLKGGASGAKTMGQMEMQALLGHGAQEILRETKLIKGQSNDSFWRDVKLGRTPVMPKTPFVYEKFQNLLQAAGINVRKEGGAEHIFAMTNSQVDKLTGDKYLRNSDTFNAATMHPIKGGLFDPDLTGAMGTQWAAIKLPEPVLNPIMEAPVRSILGLKKKELAAIANGQTEVNGLRGGPALRSMLEAVDIDKEIPKAREAIATATKTKRDAAIKRYSYLQAIKKQDLKPTDFMWDKVPVLPPKYRPIATANDLTMVADANYLYKTLLDTTGDYQAAVEAGLPDSELNDARESLNRSVQALIGTADPAQPKLVEKRVEGILSAITGKGSPKSGFIQRRVMGSNVDMTGLAVITPNPSLKLNQVGLPEKQAWKLYEPFIVRELVRRGYSAVEAAKQVSDHAEPAYRALQQVVQERPIMYNRAPTLHKYSIMAAWPVLTKGSGLQIPPAMTGPFGADFDGNCCDFDTKINVEISESALDYWRELMHGKDNFQRKELSMLANTQVTVLGDERYTLKIGDFPRHGSPIKDKNGADVYTVPPGIKVLSVDPDTGCSAYMPVTHFTVEQDCPSVTVKAGNKEVVVSDNESLAVFDHTTGNLVKKAPAESEGSFVAVVKSPGVYGTEGTAEFGWWLGMFVSDGWVTGKQLGLAKAEDAKREAFVAITRKCICDNFYVNEYSEKVDKSTAYKLASSKKLHIHSPELTDFVREHALVNNDDPSMRQALRKQLPSNLLDRLSREALLGLFAGLIDGDGCLVRNTSVAKARFGLRFNTSSVYLRDSLLELLFRLGIDAGFTTTQPSAKRLQKVPSFTICPSVMDTHRIMPELQFVGAAERSLQARWLAEYVPAPTSSKDVIPLTFEEAGILRKLSLSESAMGVYAAVAPKKCRKDGTPHMQRHALQTWLETHPTHPGLAYIPKRFEIRWTTVDSVEDAGKREVFDFDVPGSKVFAVNNGLIIWDTMSFTVPVTDRGVEEAINKMMPEKNLLSERNWSAHYAPSNEYIKGLYLATKQPKRRAVRVFDSVAQAKEAYRRGDIEVDDPIQIRDSK